jgi:hypothetical protein
VRDKRKRGKEEKGKEEKRKTEKKGKKGGFCSLKSLASRVKKRP